MIDLRQPLSGFAGLWLTIALMCFGGVVSIALALMFSWLPISDALANFLGGVLGAGLGAAIAVLGAVYVQHKESQERLRVPANAIRACLSDLRQDFNILRMFVEFRAPGFEPNSEWQASLRKIVANCEGYLATMPAGAELPEPVYETIFRLRRILARAFSDTKLFLDSIEKQEGEGLRRVAAEQFAESDEVISILLRQLTNLQ